jgi:formylmethanofuran dehydrogenase subunit C
MDASVQRVIVPVPAMSVSKRFGRFKDEDEKAVRKPDVKANPALEGMMQAWEGFRNTELKEEFYRGGKEYGDLLYEHALASMAHLHEVRGPRYTSKDVEKFSLALTEFQGHGVDEFGVRAGPFLSALINNGYESDFIIHTRHLEEKIHYLALHNTKNITIDGNAGDCLARCMSGGKITVEGNAGYAAAENVKGGEIVINGSCGYGLGGEMKGGKIIVNGNVGQAAGGHMENGEIVVNGDCNSDLGAGMKGGKIVVNGNAGDCAGNKMRKGEIVVNGNCGRFLGLFMGGGKITVKGNAYTYVGCGMENGEILIEGHCGDFLGGEYFERKMRGGEIRIEGELESLGADMTGGRIYHKGKLVYPRGE